MEITIRCTHLSRAACPVCGSKNIVGVGKEHCHCGQCGQGVVIEIVEKVKDNEEAEQFTQMRLF
ncbi:MAG: hypothetical protein IJZ82_03080 [Lachnospiraceae bacterium]|nr:hypothetical protein [Lachnospiraceae bacterium]